MEKTENREEFDNIGVRKLDTSPNNDFNNFGVRKSDTPNFGEPSTISVTRISGNLEGSEIPNPSFWRLLGLNKPEWKQANLGCLSAILFGVVQPVYAAIMGTIITAYFLTNHDEMKHVIKKFAFCFLGLSFFSLLISVSQHYSFSYMGENLTKRIRERMLTKMLTFEIG
ncbi:ABC transporter type 1, transmembrane domain containing protein [Parasponia andersonii]|uniref:ABC transporter type 1, transmembrane domain containing protein n=1 Tax=Parasponia andersonii TaxID=3476 RepID=A0A2P5C0V6_PARAD|nr:ABC transporter type 1, transmembrane domain containing protein [Parasponia andersonii]